MLIYALLKCISPESEHLFGKLGKIIDSIVTITQVGQAVKFLWCRGIKADILRYRKATPGMVFRGELDAAAASEPAYFVVTIPGVAFYGVCAMMPVALRI